MDSKRICRSIAGGLLWITCGATGCGPDLDRGLTTREEAVAAKETRAVVSALVLIDQPTGRIPPSFLGISQEWWLGPLSNSQLIGMFKRMSSFGTGPLILRVGGSTADIYNEVPAQSVWEVFAKLYREVGMKFIFDLNLGANDPNLTLRQKQAALQFVPRESILFFEIGNEPNYFAGKKMRPDNYLSYYPTEFKDFATAIGCNDVPCAGPAWGHIFCPAKTLDWFLKTNKDLVTLSTVHFYKANNETPNTAETLLEEVAVRKAMDSLKKQVDVSTKLGIPLRVDESNPISGGGLEGVSNVFAAALWILDTLFETANAGAVGIDFHQGSPWYSFYESRDTASPEGIYAQPAYYAILMFQEAVARSADQATVLLKKQLQGPELLKVWPIQQGNELRVLVINKDEGVRAEVKLTLGGGCYGDGTLTRLLAPSLSAKSGITLAGISYDSVAAKPSGTYQSEKVPAEKSGQNTVYSISVPAASAAMVVMKK